MFLSGADLNYAHTSQYWMRPTEQRIKLGGFGDRPAFATTYYISTTGNDANNGTSISTPWQHIEKIEGITFVAGDNVLIRAGTYSSTRTGSHSACTRVSSQNGNSSVHISISSYPGDFAGGNGRVIYDCTNFSHVSDCYGFVLQSCSWIDVIGIYVKGPSQTASALLTGALWSNGTSNNIFSNCEASNAQSGFRLDDGVNTNFLNCDAHDLDDPFTGAPTGPHQGSDGFQRTGGGNTATGTTYYGCRAYRCSDDGWDCFNTSGTITYDHCWAIKNGFDAAGNHLGDGNGFKLGPNNGSTSLIRFVRFCVAFGNYLNGFDQNGGTAICQFYNNDAINNGSNDWKFGYNQPIAHIFRNNLSFGNGLTDAGTTDDDYWNPNDHNTWNGTVTLTSADFQSTDGTQFLNARNSDGTQPTTTAYHLAATSDLIDAGIAIAGLPFNGNAPDMGAFETTAGTFDAATWYVATTGNDGNSGIDPSSPFLTLAHAESVVNSGDEVIVAAGTYTISSTLTFSHAGAASNPVEYTANGAVTLNVNATIDFTASYRKMTGFNMVCNTTNPVLIESPSANNQIVGCTFSGTFTRAVYVKTANNIIRNCTVTQAASTGYCLQIGEDDNTSGTAADNNIIDGCTLIGTNGTTTVHGVLLGGGGSDNTFKNSYVQGVYYGVVDKAEQTSLIMNNVFNFTASGMNSAMYDKGSTNSKYYNNICRMTGSGYAFLIQESDGGTPDPSGALVKNNVFIKGPDPIIRAGTGGVGSYTNDYNIWQYSSGTIIDQSPSTSYTSLTTWQGTGQDAHSIQATATFTNASGNLNLIPDFIPLSNSPQVNIGTTLTEHTSDALGSAFNGAPDVGALEFVPSSTGQETPLKIRKRITWK